MHQARINDSFSAGLTAFYLLLGSYSNCLVAEVAQISYGGALRTIALSSTEGVRLGLPAMISYNPVRVSVSLVTLGRLFNVIGASVDVYADVCFSSSFCIYPIFISFFS
jgi:F0F1-type ATP synthase beta subunit